MRKYVFILGGVISSVGKGISASSIAALLKCYGYKVRQKKLDPYLNIDPGTMSPYQHGEVFVTADGAETDLDLGHYERFLVRHLTKNDSVSGGKIYHNVLTKERKGEYKGATVQAIPHVSDEIKNFMLSDLTDEDITWLSKDYDAITFENANLLPDMAGLFRNPKYRNAMSAKKFYETVLESGYFGEYSNGRINAGSWFAPV